jgi:opacity protein-like surface antigen
LRIGIRASTLLLCLFASLSLAHAQEGPTAARGLQLYAFGGATGTYTGLAGGKNLGVTAGVDVGFSAYHGFLPTLEARGTEPFSDGTIAALKNFLGGIKVERTYGHIHPYVDFLFGRGQVDYDGAGYLNPQQTILYQRTNSNIWSPGAGVDFDITRSLAIKLDGQYQKYTVPVTTSGSIYAKPITIGVLYRFGYRQDRPEAPSSAR